MFFFMWLKYTKKFFFCFSDLLIEQDSPSHSGWKLRGQNINGHFNYKTESSYMMIQ